MNMLATKSFVSRGECIYLRISLSLGNDPHCTWKVKVATGVGEEIARPRTGQLWRDSAVTFLRKIFIHLDILFISDNLPWHLLLDSFLHGTETACVRTHPKHQGLWFIVAPLLEIGSNGLYSCGVFKLKLCNHTPCDCREKSPAVG